MAGTYNPQIVGSHFVKQYYTQLHKDPVQLHRFYLDQSSYVHGSSEIGSEEAVVGQKVIVCAWVCRWIFGVYVCNVGVLCVRMHVCVPFDACSYLF